MNTINRISLPITFDAHAHFREDEMMKLVFPYTLRQCGGAGIMPNTKRKITTTAIGREYLDMIGLLSKGFNFIPRLFCYLTDRTDPSDLVAGFREGVFYGVKFYPAGATTNSDQGVSSVSAVAHVLKVMEKEGIPLHIHGERIQGKTGVKLDPFGETEEYFLLNEMDEILKIAPGLIIFLEHISTKIQAEFVVVANEKGFNVRATITPQHLGFNRGDLIDHGGARKLDTRKVCLPLLKAQSDVAGLWEYFIYNPGYFCMGSDTAPHDVSGKGAHDGSCNCGCFNAPALLELYTTIFEKRKALNLLPGLVSRGWEFQGLPVPPGEVVLVREEVKIPMYAEGFGHKVAVFQGGETLPWRIEKPANNIEIMTSVY